MKAFFRLLAGVSLLVSSLVQAQDYTLGPSDAEQAVVELISDVAAIQPGQSFEIGLRMKLDSHWHVYWVNPGDTGLPPTIEWNAPQGFEFGELEFPTPERIPTPPFVSYGYEGEVVFLTTVQAPQELSKSETVTIQADVDWLICKDVCIPGSAQLAIELPFTQTGESLVPSQDLDRMVQARSAIPGLAEGGKLTYENLESAIEVTFDWAGFQNASLGDVHFFVEQESVVDSAKEQSYLLDGSKLVVSVPKSEYFAGELPRVSGILFNDSGFSAIGGANAVYFDSAKVMAATADPPVIAPNSDLTISFAQALLFAFLGGMILNVMPCVFPVLSIKIMGFVQQAGEDRKKILYHGIVYAFGVLVSFWILATIFLLLRAGGEAIGHGFQLQSPGFLAVMLFIMFVFGLSLAGVFEMGASAIGLQGKVRSDGYTGSFMTGVLATVVATPCTGPFMGQALGLAVTLPMAQAIIVFTFLGAGMAFPYVLLSAFPKLIQMLPRPGPWMETFKQLMAFFMFATCIALFWLLSSHLDSNGLAIVLIGLLMAALAAWIYGRWSTPAKKKPVRIFASVSALVLAVVSLWILIPNQKALASAPTEVAEGKSVDSYGLVWEKYSPELVAQLQSEGKPMYIDFTADWCAICKTNKLRVFSSSKVKEKLADLGVTLIKGDWTHRDATITRTLESFGRIGVPLNLIYIGVPNAEPLILDNTLSAGYVLDQLENVRPYDSGALAASSL